MDVTRLPEKHIKQGYGCYADLSLVFSVLRISTDLDTLLFVAQRETPSQTEISLTDINVSSKGVTSTVFSELQCVLFLKNNQIKIILCPRGKCGVGIFHFPAEPIGNFHFRLLSSTAHAFVMSTMCITKTSEVYRDVW